MSDDFGLSFAGSAANIYAERVVVGDWPVGEAALAANSTGQLKFSEIQGDRASRPLLKNLLNCNIRVQEPSLEHLAVWV